MQTNQSRFTKRYRTAHVLMLCLFMTGLSILMSFAVRGRDAQGTNEIKLSVEDGRPVAKAIEMLEKKYGWVITYEDPRYAHASEIADVTQQVRRDLDKYKPGEAPKVIVPKGGVLELTYGVSPTTKLPNDPAMVVQKLLEAQAANSNGGRFRLESNGRIMHVIPTAIKNREGRLTSQGSILDTSISLPAVERTVYQKLEGICAAISRTTKIHVGLGAYPSMFERLRDQQGAVNQRARDVLINTFETTDYGASLSWQLFYDPGLKMYMLNIHHVRRGNG